MNKEWSTKVITAFLCNTFLVGTIMLFSPLEVYLGNIPDFNFGFSITWRVMVIAAISLIMLITVIQIILPKKLVLFLNVVSVSVGICCYVQMMFLNGKMVTLSGEEMNTTRIERIINLGIWAAIVSVSWGGAVLLLHNRKEVILRKALNYASAMLTIIQSIALIVFAMTTSFPDVEDYALLGNGQFEMAQKNNTLVFVFDSTENTIFDEVLREYPEIRSTLSGFTYYPNTISKYSRTHPSLTYMVTGEMCYYNEPYEKYVRNACENGRMLKDLKAANIDNRVFTTDISKFSSSIEPYISNYYDIEPESFESVSIPDLIIGMMKISLYKVVPYRLKYELEYSMDKINYSVVNHNNVKYQYYDFEYYWELVDSDLEINTEYSGAFRFYHLFGSHHDMYWDENMNRVSTGNKVQPLRGSLKIIEEFVKKLDEAGILDETTIIVTADHGDWGESHSTDIYEVMDNPPTPIMLVKYADSDMTKTLEVSNAPLSHEDLFATVIDSCGLDASAYGKTMRDYSEEEERERYYYYTSYCREDGGELALKEYRIIGDAKSFDNWTDTGNYWDIYYSPYAVSKYTYTGEIKTEQ